MKMPWAKRIWPDPQDLMKLPLESNSRTGSSLLFSQPLSSQRSATQMFPWLSPEIALVEPMWRPAGILRKSGSRG